MSLQLITSSTGEIALFARHQLIIEGDSADDSAKLVRQTGERLARALQVPIQAVNITPACAEWDWNDLLGQIVPPAAPPQAAQCVCAKCGTLLKGSLCKDETCPYSDWPQQVSLIDMECLEEDEIAAKYNLVRAEAHSDDQICQSKFFANQWLASASAEEIKSLAREEWGRSQEADAVALSAQDNHTVGRLFEYLQICNAGESKTTGFECTVNPADALAWLRRHRFGLWAQLICEEHEVRIVEAHEPEVQGMFDWLDSKGNACAISFVSADEAALNAVGCLELDLRPPVTPLYSVFWDASAFHSPTGKDIRQLIGKDMFCEANRYDADDIAEIAGLAIGDTWESPDFGPYHTVQRVR